jgi:hypothetical protein
MPCALAFRTLWASTSISRGGWLTGAQRTPDRTGPHIGRVTYRAVRTRVRSEAESLSLENGRAGKRGSGPPTRSII